MKSSVYEAGEIRCGVICWNLQQHLRDEKYSASISVESLNLKLRNFIFVLVSDKNIFGCSRKEATNHFAYGNLMLLGLTKQMYDDGKEEKETGQI